MEVTMTGHKQWGKPFTPDPRYTESFKKMVVQENMPTGLTAFVSKQ